MLKPPVFDRNTHDRQKNLLAAEERRLEGKESFKIMSQLGGTGLLIVAVVVCLGIGLVTFFTR